MTVSDDGEQSASYFQLILDALSTQVAAVDGEGRILSCNSAWRKQFASAAPAAVEQMAQGHYLGACEAALAAHTSTTSDGYTRMQGYITALREIIRGTRDYYSMEYVVPGEDAWYRVHLTRCPSGPAKAVIQRRNITAEKKSAVAAENSRQFLQTLIDLLPTRIAWKGLDGRYQGANRAFLEDAGLPDVVGKSVRDMPWGATSGQQIDDEEQRLMATGEPQMGKVLALNRPDGSVRWIHSDRLPLVAANGAVYGLLVAYVDITAIKAAEDALNRQALELKRLALVAEHTSNAVLIMDKDRRITWANPAFTRMSGYTLADVMGQRPRGHLLSPAASPESQEIIRKAVASRSGYQQEQLDRSKDGRDYWVAVDHQPLFDNGELSGWIAIKRDINDQVALRQKLLAAEQRVQTTVEAARFGLYEANFPTKTILPGPGWCELLGLPAADSAIPFANHFDLIHGEDRVQAGRDARKKASASDALFAVEYRIRHANGNWIRVRNAGRVIERDGSGIPTRIVGVLTDITEGWLAEQQLAVGAERLAMATQAAGIGVWEQDLHADKAYFDSRMREICGLPADLPDTAISIKQLASMCHPDDLSILTKMKREFSASAHKAAVEFRIIRPDGMLRHLDVRGLIHRDKDGKALRVVGVTMDVTERNQLLQERQTGQRLESIGQLAAGIAHEINTPTQYIGDNTGFLKDGFGQLLELLDRVRADPPPTAAELKAAWKAADADYLREEIPRAIEQSLEGIKRVSGIVRAMKEFSHPATERTPHDLNRAIQSTVMVASNEWKYVAEMATDLDPALPAVPVMPGEFNQVILNMVVNAAHAIAAVPGHDGTTKGRISITTRLDGDQAVIILSDSGCGMPDEVKKRIFEPFFTTKEVGRGTGQGLAITHNFVTKHDGTINVDSTPGKGTTFTLRLPISIEETPAQVA